MRRHRRSVLVDRIIPFLAAGVGLIALAAAVMVQMNTEAKTRALFTEIAALHAAVDQLDERATALSSAQDDGTAAGLLALQDRMTALEGRAEALAASADQVALRPGQDGAVGAVQTASAEIDPNLPTTDCIPLGKRFMVLPNETYQMCQSTAVIKVDAITGDSVSLNGTAPIVETGFGKLIGTDCTVMVFSADPEGFAEVRVTCT